MDLSQLNISLETIVTVGAAVLLFLRIHTGIDGIRKELKGDIEGLRQELKGDINGLRQDLNADNDGLRQELKGNIEGLRQDLKADILRVEQKSEDAHKSINDKLASIQAEQAAQSERFNTVWERFNTVDERFNRVDDHLGRLDEKVDEIRLRPEARQ